MTFERKAYHSLLKWKDKKGRKPLIIRGARQVGKTTLINDFSKEFAHYIYLNLEKADNRRIFEKTDQIRDIVDSIFLKSEVPMDHQPTLLFLDEIQESPEAIQQLRYFYEEYPQLHIISAGSLLEFALKKVASFPVGRVEQMVLHPFNFEEFLSATDKKNALNEFHIIPVKEYAHSTLLQLFHQYAIIGGMPGVIERYVSEASIINIGELYDNLWQSYLDDVEKYASNLTERNVIRHIINSAPFEKDRIRFAGFGNSDYRSREVGESLRALDMARIIQLIYPTTCVQPPIIPDYKRKPRLQFVDTGLLNHSLGLQGEMIALKDLNDFYRGRILQHLVTQQIQSLFDSPLYKPSFWVREKANSNAEVDFVFHHNKYIIPIEIKSGSHGRLRSLHQFIDITKYKYGVRLLANQLSVEKVTTPAGTDYFLMNLPYYLVTRIPEYVDWFITKYS
jgi:hypothetical protein